MVYNALGISILESDVSLFKSIESGQFQAYTAALTFDELAYRMLLSLIRDQYGKSPLDRLRKDRKGMVADFYPNVEKQLSQLQLLPMSSGRSSILDSFHGYDHLLF